MKDRTRKFGLGLAFSCLLLVHGTVGDYGAETDHKDYDYSNQDEVSDFSQRYGGYTSSPNQRQFFTGLDSISLQALTMGVISAGASIVLGQTALDSTNARVSLRNSNRVNRDSITAHKNQLLSSCQVGTMVYGLSDVTALTDPPTQAGVLTNTFTQTAAITDINNMITAVNALANAFTAIPQCAV